MTRGPAARCGPDDYRDMMSAFPTGVAVVTATGGDGQPYGLTCSSLNSVTLTPPTLLVCIATGSSTLGAVLAGGAFAVNLLHCRARRAAVVFARPVADRFAEVAWQPGPGGLPHLTEDAFATADCQVTRTAEVGDHVVVFGEVTAVAHTPGRPLLYGLRSFSSWPERRHAWNVRSFAPLPSV